MKRRTFISITAAGAAALYLPFTGCGPHPDPVVQVLDQPRFLSAIGDQEAIRKLGEAYRSLVPGEDNPARLIDLLLGEAHQDQTGKIPAGKGTDWIESWSARATDRSRKQDIPDSAKGADTSGSSSANASSRNTKDRPQMDASTLSAALERRIMEDYDTGRIIPVKGWILSLTEARQAALYSLQSA